MCKVDMSKPNPKYINPMTDFGFKKIFSDPTVMLGVITDIVQPSSPISELTFLDPNMLPTDRAKRGLFYDLHCKTEDGQEFIVEMQKRSQAYFADRIVYYLSRAIAPQGEKGKKEVIDGFGNMTSKTWNYELHPVYGIFFLDFHLDKKNPQPLHTVMYMDEEARKPFSDKVKAFVIELPCYKQKVDECKSGIERWAYFMNNVEGTRDTLPFAEGSPAFTRAYEIAELAKMTDEERYAYQADIEFERSNAAAIDFGLQEAHEQGIKEGRAEERELLNKENILRMRKKGFDDVTIADLLNLDVSYVNQY